MIYFAYFFAFVIIAVYAPKIVGAWLHNRKYPIVCNEMPNKILHRGDILILENCATYRYEGRDETNIDLVFTPEDTLLPVVFRSKDIKNAAIAIKNNHGYKWIKSNIDLVSVNS